MFIQVTSTSDKKRVVNTDFIVLIELGMVRPAYSMDVFNVLTLSDASKIEISNEEWQRIAPLLTNEPASMPSALPADVVDAYHHWHEMSNAFEFSSLTDSLRDLIRALAKHIPAQETDNDMDS